MRNRNGVNEPEEPEEPEESSRTSVRHMVLHSVDQYSARFQEQSPNGSWLGYEMHMNKNRWINREPAGQADRDSRGGGMKPLYRWPSICWMLTGIPFYWLGYLAADRFGWGEWAVGGAFIGLVLGAGIWFILMWVSSRREEKRHRRAHLRSLYESMEKLR